MRSQGFHWQFCILANWQIIINEIFLDSSKRMYLCHQNKKHLLIIKFLLTWKLHILNIWELQ